MCEEGEQFSQGDTSGRANLEVIVPICVMAVLLGAVWDCVMIDAHQTELDKEVAISVSVKQYPISISFEKQLFMASSTTKLRILLNVYSLVVSIFECRQVE